MNFNIKQKTFEGPFEKLLELIEKKKLSINEVSLSKITDEYIEYLNQNNFRLKDTTKFVWVASILILLKSKSLLPKLSFKEEDQEDIKELKKRLKIFKVFKEASQKIEKIIFKNRSYKKLIKRKIEKKFRPEEKINQKNILLAMDHLISNYKFEKKLEEKKIEKQKSLKEILEEVKNKIERYIRISFKELVIGADKKETAVSFLSILELFRNNFINLEQEKDFAEIKIEKK